jgi:hypothetical protein
MQRRFAWRSAVAVDWRLVAMRRRSIAKTLAGQYNGD